jgi:hypothetical protein
MSGLSYLGRQRNTIITLMSGVTIPLMHLRGADRRQHTPESKLRDQNKSIGVENLMTLKQACSSEYQGAQGAFKDSMIH